MKNMNQHIINNTHTHDPTRTQPRVRRTARTRSVKGTRIPTVLQFVCMASTYGMGSSGRDTCGTHEGSVTTAKNKHKNIYTSGERTKTTLTLSITLSKPSASHKSFKMADNKLRCALAFRVEITSSAVGGDDFDSEGNTTTGSKLILLAKYDHLLQYEANPTCDALYVGRDKHYADAVMLVISKDPPKPAVSFGGFKVVQSEIHQVVYGADSEGLCMAVITGHKYPSHVAIQMLAEQHQQFKEKFGIQVQSATTDSITCNAKTLFSTLCKRYEDPAKVDKASALLENVNLVKSKMQSNIATMLANQEKAEGIAELSEQLNEQAKVFKRLSTNLKNKMRWKDMKMTIIIALVVIGIMILIFAPFILHVKAALGK